MRRIVAVAGFLGLSLGLAAAESAPTEPDTCEVLDHIAEASMEARQAGVPMADLYKMASKDAGAPGAGAIKLVINEAYKWPLRASAQGRQRAVTEFRNQFFQGCIESQGSVGK